MIHLGKPIFDKTPELAASPDKTESLCGRGGRGEEEKAKEETLTWLISCLPRDGVGAPARGGSQWPPLLAGSGRS